MPSHHPTPTTYEYEERAFLTDESFLRIKQILDEKSARKTIDNKQSFFFVLPDVNVSIASSAKETKVKYKGGQLGKGNGFEEIEYTIDHHSLESATTLFTRLLKIKPQASFQFRINYVIDDLEVALKYTQMWGFHIEVECVYTASSTIEQQQRQQECYTKLKGFADNLGFRYITDEEMAIFTEECKQEKNRGEYTPEVFTERYGELFGL